MRFTPREIHRFTDEQALSRVVRAAGRDGRKVRVAGARHSFSPLVATTDAFIRLDDHTGIVTATPGRVVVRSGTRLKALGQSLMAQGVAMENLGDVDVQTVGGAVSTGTHGTGLGLRTLSSQITGARILLASGEVVACSETENPELLRLARISLGLMGVFLDVELAVVPRFKLRCVWRKERLADVVDNLVVRARASRHFEFFWMPYTDLALTKTSDVTTLPVRDPAWHRIGNDVLLENLGIGLLGEACRLRPASSPSIARLIAASAGTRTKVNWSHRLFATTRWVRFHEMEYAVPVEQTGAVLLAMDKAIRRAAHALSLPTEVRFVGGDDVPLSPAYGRDSAYIAVHMHSTMDHRRYFAAMEEIFLAHGGRPHWGKMHTQTARTLRGLYPEWETFGRMRRDLDPKDLWLTPYLAELFE